MRWLSSAILILLVAVIATSSSATVSHTAAKASIDAAVATHASTANSLKLCSEFKSQTGVRVTRREQGAAVEGAIRVLGGRSGLEIYVIGPFNGWGKYKSEADRLLPIAGTPYYEGKFRQLAHGMEYRLLIDGSERIDPAASSFTPAPQKLNSVFWDFARASAFQPRTQPVDLHNRALVSGEAEVYELARKFPRKDGELGPGRIDQTYTFIATSGLIEELKAAGYNAIEFLPFNASVDSLRWQDRYKAYGLFAPDPRYGSPDDFLQMIDAFHGQGIAVIMRASIDQFAARGNQAERKLESSGLQSWQRPNGRSLFSGTTTSSELQNFDFGNRFVRRFLSDSLLHMACRYSLDGVRFDDFSPASGEIDKKNRQEFVQEFAKAFRKYRPAALFITNVGRIDVVHKNQLVPSVGQSANQRNQALLSYFEQMFAQSTDKLDLAPLQSIFDQSEGGSAASSIHQLTDLASNRKSSNFQKYLASRLHPGSHFFVGRRTMALGSLAMLTGTAYRDLPQTRLLQDGSFASDLAVDWDLMRHAQQRNTYDYFSEISRIFSSNPVFAQKPVSQIRFGDSENNSAYRILAFEREDQQSRWLIVVNLGHIGVNHYKLGVSEQGNYRLAVDSDGERFGGSGELERRIGTGVLITDDAQAPKKYFSLSIPYIAPYSTILLYRDSGRN